MFRLAIFCSAMIAAFPANAAEPIWFGDNTSQYADDGECDDRRFIGKTMDENLNSDDIAHDSNDCKTAFDAGKIKLWYEHEARAVTQCSRIDFGDNSSEWANDGDCDDPRFEGRGSASGIASVDRGKDANDCSIQCKAGMIFIRNY